LVWERNYPKTLFQNAKETQKGQNLPEPEGTQGFPKTNPERESLNFKPPLPGLTSAFTGSFKKPSPKEPQGCQKIKV